MNCMDIDVVQAMQVMFGVGVACLGWGMYVIVTQLKASES